VPKQKIEATLNSAIIAGLCIGLHLCLWEREQTKVLRERNREREQTIALREQERKQIRVLRKWERESSKMIPAEH
jgi:hypothetical protein